MDCRIPWGLRRGRGGAHGAASTGSGTLRCWARSRRVAPFGSWLWGISGRIAPAPAITVAMGRRPRLSGVEVHRTRVGFDIVKRDGIACTGLVRTLVDCAAILSADDLADLVDRALANRVVTLSGLDRGIESRSVTGLPGRGALRRCLLDRGMLGGPAPSVLESRMARLFRRHRLPTPCAEVTWGDRRQYRLDFAFPAIRLAVEVDGYTWHSSPEQLERDHRRRNELTAAGWVVLVYTWRDIDGDEARVAAEIADAHRRLTPGGASRIGETAIGESWPPLGTRRPGPRIPVVVPVPPSESPTSRSR